MLRVFTACSGYDSQCLALEVLEREQFATEKIAGRIRAKCGFMYDLIGWSEIDKYAIKAHNVLFPQWADRNFGDLSKIDWESVPDFDLFTYSTPCQDFSQAGKQRGGAKGSGTRSSLLWECERAIATKKPKYLLMENVAALVSKKFIKLFNEWQLTLDRLGYTNFTQVLNAKTHGYPAPVPQNRERVFMVSILNCEEPFYFPEPQTLTTRLKDVLEPNVDEKYYLSDKAIDGFNRHAAAAAAAAGNGFGWNPTDGDCIGNTIQTNSERPSGNYIKVAGELTDGAYAKRHKSSQKVYDTDGVSPTLNTCGGGGTETKIVLGWTRDAKGKLVDRHPVEVANTVTSAKRDNTQNYVLEF